MSTPAERATRALADVARMLDVADRIVARGYDEFVGDDEIAYLATKALLIDLQTACGAFDEEFRAARPRVPWRELKRIRDRLAHHYVSIDKDLLWNVLVRELPVLRADLLAPDG
ncbi:HepT-like ribonuclease domain-containing protein [Cellulomonas uda]|uniref:DUF86 domain-containing protein n=1 Tax=Cellulomonas uda TaxID=1714 RepID=A0A4Y3KEL6_CELUD|nr:HepT-like ribonuclease domain-containing protein [Cellulomonas uda]NII67677.1 uncharacterized protein with HEPN domain [Cellulomonas uda]GEA81485.1 hypothetical protein CUD01_19290 [Cellulomonas uda]